MKSLFLVILVWGICLPSLDGRKFYTPLKGYYEFACVVENLVESSTYYCDSNGKVRCLPGWSNPYHLCKTPICTINNQTCINGNCSKPFTCDCEVGWKGNFCEKCVRLPGCANGYCNRSLECNCYPGWEGMFCDKPSCPGCIHGECMMPGMCSCHPGWSGPNCTICEPRLDCNFGRCVDEPFECRCFSKYEGVSCNQPMCSEGCHPDNGYCEIPETCLCRPGWTGENCTECVPYWNCQNGRCIDDPWVCVCDEDYVGPDCSVRGNVDGNWGAWGSWGDCSVDCGIGVQTRIRSCDNPATSGNGSYCSQDGSSCEEQRPCEGQSCTGPGLIWGQWGSWSDCSVSCGGGERGRVRDCLIPAMCEDGLQQDDEVCNSQPCPINGGFTLWTPWSPCTARCVDEVGDEVRRRTCTNPEPQFGGLDCAQQNLGIDREQRLGCFGTVPRQNTDPNDFCFTIGS